MSIQVIRAVIQHLENVVPLFDAYRIFYRQRRIWMLPENF